MDNATTNEQAIDREQITEVTIGATTFTFEYSDLLPSLTEVEYESLSEDIRHRGVQVSVVTDEHQNVLDGKHRLLSAHDHGQTNVPIEIIPGLSEEEKRDLALDLNLHRRHLTAEQRQQVIVKLRQQGLSWRQIARRMHVSPETARRDVDNATVQDVTVELPDHVVGDDGKKRPAKMKRQTKIVTKNIREASKAGEAIRAVAADELPRTTMDARRLGRVVRECKAAKRREQEVEDCEIGSVRLMVGRFQDRLEAIPDESVDLIFTDPPYDAGSLPLWEDLAKMAAQKLKPGGIVASYSGQSSLPRIYALLEEHLKYVWTCAVQHADGHNAQWGSRMLCGWKPLLVFAKPPFKATWDPFLDWHSGGQAKLHHEWQQSVDEAAYFIEALCPRGGMVVDPMMGSGTTGIAAITAGRSFVGIDVDAAAVATARERMEEVTQGLEVEQEEERAGQVAESQVA